MPHTISVMADVRQCLGSNYDSTFIVVVVKCDVKRLREDTKRQEQSEMVRQNQQSLEIKEI